MPEIIVDKFGAVFPRFASNTAIHSALCTWIDENGQEFLVLGNSAVSYPNLTFASFDVVTEEGIPVADASVNSTLGSVYNTKNLDFDLPDVEKQIRSIDFVYQDHPDWATETITIKYRIDQAGENNVPTFTSIGTITLGTATYDYETKHKNIPFDNLSNSGKFFEFRFEADDHFRINKMIIYYDILSKMY